MKIIITGGHFSPAYSIIQKLKTEHEILVIGRKHAFEGDDSQTYEYKLCQKLDIPFRILTTGRLQRKFSSRTIPSFAKFPAGVYQALRILKSEKPDVVVTFGGYVGLPVAMASKILGIPVVLHEQTQKAGLSARLISKVADVILISFESSRNYFNSKKTVLTGNPIRPEFFEKNSSIKVKKPAIYITGGSTGSHFINDVVSKIRQDLTKDFHVYHQTGNAKEFGDFEKLVKVADDKYEVSEFYSPQDVYTLLSECDLVISRSGINTITELLLCNTTALLIPLPFGQQNEQKDNAKFFSQLGMGEYMDQDDVSPLSLLLKIRAMIKDKDVYRKNAKNAEKYVISDASERIVEQILMYGGRGKKGNESKPL